MSNPYNSNTAPSGPNASSWDIVPVTPSDDTDLAIMPRAFYAAVAGNIRVMTAAGVVRVVPIGAFQIIPAIIKRVYATGTTATGIVALTS